MTATGTEDDRWGRGLTAGQRGTAFMRLAFAVGAGIAGRL
ncbi:unnamed protein product [[Actinomadura] parvosata subsp. kistnae]|nr:unnamed protein product [Actinomadura parvosata subsp. kistnae]